MLDSIIKKYNDYKNYEAKTLLGSFVQTFFTNLKFAVLVSMVVTVVTLIVLGVAKADHDTLLITAAITGFPIIVSIIYLVAYCFFVRPIKWIISKLKK